MKRNNKITILKKNKFTKIKEIRNFVPNKKYFSSQNIKFVNFISEHISHPAWRDRKILTIFAVECPLFFVASVLYCVYWVLSYIYYYFFVRCHPKYIFCIIFILFFVFIFHFLNFFFFEFFFDFFIIYFFYLNFFFYLSNWSLWYTSNYSLDRSMRN